MNIETIILRNIKWSDSSLITHALTDEYGKISIMTKGAYRKKENVLPNFELFSITSFELGKGDNIFYFNEIDESVSFQSLHSNPLDFRLSCIACEILLKSLEDNFRVPNIYPLTKNFILSLPNNNNKLLLLSAWILKYVSFMGYEPLFDAEGESLILFNEGIVRESEFHFDSEYQPITNTEKNVLQYILYNRFSDIDKIDLDLVNSLHFLQLCIKYFGWTFDIQKLNSYVEFIEFMKWWSRNDFN